MWDLNSHLSESDGETEVRKEWGASGLRAVAAAWFPSFLIVMKVAPPLAGQLGGGVQGGTPFSPAQLYFTCPFITICKAVSFRISKNICIWTKVPKKRAP